MADMTPTLDWSIDPELDKAASSSYGPMNPDANVRPTADAIVELLRVRLKDPRVAELPEVTPLMKQLAQVFANMKLSNAQLENVNLLQVLDSIRATNPNDLGPVQIAGVSFGPNERMDAAQTQVRYRDRVITTIQDELSRTGKSNSVDAAAKILDDYQAHVGADKSTLTVDPQQYFAPPEVETKTVTNPDGSTQTVDVTPSKIVDSGDGLTIDWNAIANTQPETPEYKLQDINRYVIEENVNSWGQQWLGRNLTQAEVTSLIETMDRHRKKTQREWNPADHNQIQFGELIDPNTNLELAATSEYLGTTFAKERRSMANANALDTLKRRIT